jgi:hypothetical protein
LISTDKVVDSIAGDANGAFTTEHTECTEPKHLDFLGDFGDLGG